MFALKTEHTLNSYDINILLTATLESYNSAAWSALLDEWEENPTEALSEMRNYIMHNGSSTSCGHHHKGETLRCGTTQRRITKIQRGIIQLLETKCD